MRMTLAVMITLMILEIYYNDDINDDSNDDDVEQTYMISYCFVLPVYYTEMRTNLKFERFCKSCKENLRCKSMQKLHIFSNSYFQFE